MMIRMNSNTSDWNIWIKGMMMRCIIAVGVLVVLFTGVVRGQFKQAITGADFDRWVMAQHVELQQVLDQTVPANSGCFVTGPLQPTLESFPEYEKVYHAVRVVCPSLESVDSIAELFTGNEKFDIVGASTYIDDASDDLPGFRGVLVRLNWQDTTAHMALLTIQQLRFLIWGQRSLLTARMVTDSVRLAEYAHAVSDYLYSLDVHRDATVPDAGIYGLPDSIALLAPDPDYIIQGYQNYKDFLHSYRAIYTEYASGVLEFIPGDSLLTAIKNESPSAAFPNKEAPRLQEELEEFYERGGDPRVMETLTRTGFDSLRPGEYFFAVALDGEIRFGRELLREEVQRIETETGRKVPRGNHAFLFPGEPLLTAGAFFVERDERPRLTAVNAQSGHYFYSNVTETIHEDIAERSNYYLSTIGHFFEALDSLGINHDNVLISKF